MGKKSKTKAERQERKPSSGGSGKDPELPAAPTHNPGSKPPPYSSVAAGGAENPLASVVARLPSAPTEIWQVLLAENFLMVGDASQALWGAGGGLRPLGWGAPLPDLATPEGREALGDLLLTTMARPRDGAEAPRRPSVVLLDPDLPPAAAAAARAAVAGPTGVPVEPCTSEAMLAAVCRALYVPALGDCSWGAAARAAAALGSEAGPELLLTAARCLPRREDEAWTCGVFLMEEGGEQDRPHLVVERAKEGPALGPGREGTKELLVGGGPVPVPLVHHALLATMLHPMSGKRRRPGMIIFQPNLGGHFGSYEITMKELGIKAVLETD